MAGEPTTAPAPEMSPDPTPAATPASSIEAGQTPIIGIGASAGGLEACEAFFRNVQPHSGLAYVVVQHLSPDHVSMLTEILQRSTHMKVMEAQHDMRLKPDCVYVMPPNSEMTVSRGTLQLTPPLKPRGHNLPINTFFYSLARDGDEAATGIILSGTGSDGTLGLKAIMEAGGITMVQAPDSAKYGGMPTSAIQQGVAMYVLPVEEMPARLLLSPRQYNNPQQPDADLGTLLTTLRNRTGHDFSQYKKTTIRRRIARRMGFHHIDSVPVYTRFLGENPLEANSLFQELLINVTQFFRDPEVFKLLQDEVLPQIFQGRRESDVVRVWISGCASGEEAYSVAILFREYLDAAESSFKVQIYATDLDDKSIPFARSGLYPPNIEEHVSPERLRRFFTKEEGGYRVKKMVREMLVFAVQNVIKDPPFTQLDLLCCRNLMIYLEPELQNQLVRAFHYALKPGGVLCLSPSESIGNHSDIFDTLDRRWKLYKTRPTARLTPKLMMEDTRWMSNNKKKQAEETPQKSPPINFTELTRRSLLQTYAPASVVTDLQGNIVYVYGETGKYLRPAPGHLTFNIVDMARGSLQLELKSAINLIVQNQQPTVDHEVAALPANPQEKVSFSVRHLTGTGADQGFLIVSFKDVLSSASDLSLAAEEGADSAELQRIRELERQLAQAQDNLQATLEVQQATNEEYKSASEEMQSTNEELQSTNEELETSREELRSINEELTTVNAELHHKIGQLADLQDDLKNLFENINVGTILLDLDLNIRRFTREATHVYRLVDADVGRPLADIKSSLTASDLTSEAQTVLDTLKTYESHVLTIDGGIYLARIQPYRTLDNRIAGVVLTFTDIGAHVLAEKNAQRAQNLAEALVDTVHEILLVLDGQLTVISASRAFYAFFQVKYEDTIGRPLYELGTAQWDITALRELLENILPQHTRLVDYDVNIELPTLGKRALRLNASRILDTDSAISETQMILLAMTTQDNL